MINIDLNYLKGFYPPQIASDSTKAKYILKEYIELLVLDYLTTLPSIKKLAFIGGTNLRLVKGIHRFSEDLDFDCKNLSKDEFKKMSETIVKYLNKQGFNAIIKENINEERLKAYRTNIYFPELLYNLGLSSFKEERFLLKIEAQDQGINYNINPQFIARNGFNITIPSPSDEILLSMKLSALINRRKGRDFYDCMYLLQRTLPDFDFLEKKIGINNIKELFENLNKVITDTNMNMKQKDFAHLLFNSGSECCIENIGQLLKNKLKQTAR